jgi:dTDP-4-dehydrorhamnose reductase
MPLLPISTRAYAAPARRPPNARLDCSKIEGIYGLSLPTWERGVEQCVARLAAEASADTRRHGRVAELAGVE